MNRKTRKLTAELKKYRKHIDRADQEILDALALRFRAVRKVGKIKEALKLPVVQKVRWSEVMKTRRIKAKRLGLSPDFIERVYKRIHLEAISIQRKSRRSFNTSRRKKR